MKYFLDTEFIEGFWDAVFYKKRHFIDLISIGIVCEDGREYYAVSNEYNPNNADDWVKLNVLLPIHVEYIPIERRVGMHTNEILKWKVPTAKSNKQIANEILDFFGCWRDVHFYRAPEGIEVYGYYADYDWVLFCSLFGRMIDLPKGFPMYCIDLKQSFDEDYPPQTRERVKQSPDYPKQSNEHNALDDAKWNFELYKFLTTTI